MDGFYNKFNQFFTSVYEIVGPMPQAARSAKSLWRGGLLLPKRPRAGIEEKRRVGANLSFWFTRARRLFHRRYLALHPTIG